MPNANVFERLVGAGSPAQGSNAIPALALASNTETLFTNQLGNTAIAAPNGGILASTGVAGTSFGSSLDLFPFKVRVVFRATTGGSSTAIIALYVGSTIVSGNKIATITSQSLATTSASGYLEANMIWDSVSQKLNGTQLGAFGTQVVSSTALSNTNISVTSLSGLQFVCSANLGSNVSGNTFVISEFVMEAV